MFYYIIFENKEYLQVFNASKSYIIQTCKNHTLNLHNVSKVKFLFN